MKRHSYHAHAQAEVRRVRRDLASRSPEEFARAYLESICNLPFSRMHLELFTALGGTIKKRGARLAIAAPRGHAKSTIVSLAFVLWCILYEKEKLVVIVSATKEQAALLLSHIKEQLQKNERLLADFPEVCRPERARYRTKPWRDNRILLPNGAMVCSYGEGQGLRGARNDKHRPGLIIADDLENTDRVIVEEQRQKLRTWFNGTLLHAGHPETNVIVVGTVLHHDSLLANLIHPLQGRGWTDMKYKAIERFSPRAELWETWSTIFRRQEEFEDKTGPDAAKSYFVANKKEMLKKVKVLWPEWEDYHDLMIMREREGRGSFQSEKQNEPLDPELCLFSEEIFHYWDEEHQDEQHLLDAVGRDGYFYGACDPSLGKRTGSGDFSAIIILYQQRKPKVNYVLVADIKRRSPDETIEQIVHYAQTYRFNKFGVEGNHFQQLTIDNLKNKVSSLGIRLPIETIDSRSNKQARISSLEPEISQGHLKFYRRHQLLLDQLRQFPLGMHDDGPDALEMAMTIASKPRHICEVSYY